MGIADWPHGRDGFQRCQAEVRSGWLLWNCNVCLVPYADDRWTMS
jgi:hypothetical protein